MGETLAAHDLEYNEKILDLAQVPQVLSRLQLVFHFFTIRGRHGKTHAAHRDVPPPMRLAPRWQECPRCMAARQSIFQQIFFLKSISRRGLCPPAYQTAPAHALAKLRHPTCL